MAANDVSRRSVLRGGAALAAVPAVAQSLFGTRAAEAKAPFAKSEPAGFHRLNVGDFEVTVVSDGPLAMGDARKFVNAIEPAEIAKRLEAQSLSVESAQLQQNVVVVNTGSRLAIIDTGVGPNKMFGETSGRLIGNLAASGIDVASVDAVVLSHCHVDHLGGLVDAAGKATFPNAELFVNAEDQKFWSNEANLPDAFKAFAAITKTSLAPYRDRTTFLTGGKEVIPGIVAIDAPGHTVGHTAFMIASGKASLALTADCAHHHVLMVETPRAEFAYDTDAKLAVATRLKMWDMLSADRIPMLAYHFPWPGLGHIVRADGAYRYIPEPVYR